MAQDAILYRVNLLVGPTTVIKNGSGGGAPAIDEDAEYPLANGKLISRYRFVRSSSAPPGTWYFDYDRLADQTVAACGLAMFRAYRKTTGPNQVKIYSATAAGGYPGGFTLRATINLTAGVTNDDLVDISTSPAGRYWRWEFLNVAGQFSFNPWLILPVNITTLTQGGRGSEEGLRRVREREREAFMGGRQFNDLGIGAGEKLREFRIPFPALTQTQLDNLRLSQRGNFLYRHHDGTVCEVRHSDPELASTQLGIPISQTQQHRTEMSLVQVP